MAKVNPGVMAEKITPEALKALADEAAVDIAWVTKAKAAMIEAADEWSWSQTKLLESETLARAFSTE